MIEIETLRKYFNSDCVIVTKHAAERFREKDISVKDIMKAVMQGIIIEQYPDDMPFPSCLVMGDVDGKILHIVMSDEGNGSRIITSYWPDLNRWENDYKTRKVNKT